MFTSKTASRLTIVLLLLMSLTFRTLLVHADTIQQVATPTASVTGAVEKGTQVTFGTTTSGAAIYYTTDGTTPSASSTLYTGPITVNSAETIRVMATESGFTDSVVADFSYTINMHTVTYSIGKVDFGSGPHDKNTYAKGDTVTIVDIGLVTKVGYSFGGWSDGTNVYKAGDTLTMGSSDIILSAIWNINQYTANFNSEGGTAVAPITLDYGTPIKMPVPTKTGYTFTGWFTDSNLQSVYIFGQMPAADFTLYAGWSLTPYNINYELNGGILNSNNDSVYTIISGIPVLPSPVRKGYTFEGWYANADLSGTKVTSIAIGSTGDVTLYANWHKKPISPILIGVIVLVAGGTGSVLVLKKKKSK